MDSSTTVLQYGLAGVVMLVESVVIRYLYTELQRSQDRERQSLEARRVDAKETLEKVEGPLSSIAQSTKFIADKLIAVKKEELP